MSFKFLFNFILIMAYAISTYAQNRFVRGYIITLNKDTVYGFIQDRNELNNSRLVKFKPSLESKTEKFSPESLTAYYISNGNVYFSRLITEQTNIAKFKKVFLKRLAEGSISLYSYLSGGARRIFLEKDSGGLKELIHLLSEKSFNKTTLSSLLTDCPDFNINKINFQVKPQSLIKLIASYSQCLQTRLSPPLTVVDKDPPLKEPKIVQGPQIYIRPFIRYNLPLTLQSAPEYLSLKVTNPFNGKHDSDVTSDIKKFSVARGISYGGLIGYRFNEFIGIELGFEYFNFKNTIESDHKYYFVGTGKSAWNFKSFNSIPAFTFSENFNKSVLTGKLGAIIGLSTLDNSIYVRDADFRQLKAYTFSKNLSMGYMLGFEYSYFFRPGLSFSFESGIENYSYTPKSAKLTKYLEYGRDETQSSPENIKKIEYRNEIRNISDFNNSGPEIRIKEALAIRKIYLGIGIKFIINKNEKN